MDVSRCWLGSDCRRNPHLAADVQDPLEMGQTEVQMAAIGRVTVVPPTGGICHAILYHCPHNESLCQVS